MAVEAGVVFSKLKAARRKWKCMPLDLMVLSGLALVFIFRYVPMGGILMAFEKYNPAKGLWRSPWIGLENFRYLLSLPDTLPVLRNTLVISVLKIAASKFSAICVAILLNEVGKSFMKRSIQTMIYLPHFLSWVILGGVLKDVLSPSVGIVNAMIKGIGFEPVFFLGKSRVFPFTLMFTHVWKECGFGTIVYLAAISNIDPCLYESSIIDGAGRIKQTWYITLPGMMPIIVLTLLLSLGDVLDAGFDQVFNLYSPLVYKTGDVLDTFLYRLGLVQYQFGVATAVGVFKSIVSLILMAVTYYIAYRAANYRIF